MKNCKKCNKEFEPVKGLINYCSLTCRNSREWSEEAKIKKSIAAKNSEKVKMGIVNKPKELFIKIGLKRKENHKIKILNEDFDKLCFNSLRWRVFYEQEEKCNKCGLDKWLGEKITLELEHKDGNNLNNKRENLEGLCPNCHSQTKTWKGKNKKQNKKKITDEELLNELLKSNWNMRQALLNLNLTPKGGNYKRCYSLKRLI